MSKNNEHQKTDALAAEVRACAKVGVPHHAIAKLVGISTHTLLRHYRAELDYGKAHANAVIARDLYIAAAEGNVTAQIFFLKCRAGWRAQTVIQTQPIDSHGRPIEPPKLSIRFDDDEPDHTH